MGTSALLDRPPVDRPVDHQPPQDRSASPGRSWGRWLGVAIALVVLAAFVAGVTGGGDDGESATSPDELAVADGGAEEAADGAVGNGALATTGAGAAAPVAPTQSDVPLAQPRVVTTGSVDLEVPEGEFQSTVEAITSKVVGLGGFVADATTSDSGDEPSGSIVVRVPSASYDAFLADVKRLGEVRSVTTKGTDVSAEFTDLEARIGALDATRQRLTTMLGETQNVGELLQVQDRITAVQTEIEQYQGQLRLLDDQSAMATLSITLGEPGAERVELSSNDDDGLGGAWRQARDRFGDGLEGIVSWSGVLVLLAMLGAMGFAGYRWVWIRARGRLGSNAVADATLT